MIRKRLNSRLSSITLGAVLMARLLACATPPRAPIDSPVAPSSPAVADSPAVPPSPRGATRDAPIAPTTGHATTDAATPAAPDGSAAVPLPMIDAAGTFRLGERGASADEVVAMIGRAPETIRFIVAPEARWGDVLRAARAVARHVRWQCVAFLDDDGQEVIRFGPSVMGSVAANFEIASDGSFLRGADRVGDEDVVRDVRRGLHAGLQTPNLAALSPHSDVPFARVRHLASLARSGGAAFITIDAGGALEPEVIRGVITANLSQVSACHDEGLAQVPTARGRIVIRFDILGDGSVQGPSLMGCGWQ